jgi:four helix bundle protein
MQRFSKLQVWVRSHALVLMVYELSATFPTAERYGLTAQLRRAAVAVPTNIAEGAKRQTARDFAHFLNIAEGSLAETEYLLLLAHDLRHLTADPPFAECEEILRMLHVLRMRVLERGDSSRLV